MSFREKILWVAFITMVGGFGFYFLTLLTPIGKDASPDYYLGLLFLIIGLVVGSMLIATMILFIRNRSEITFKEDERDRNIHKAATQIAYYPLLLGVWASGALFHNGVSVPTMLNILMAVLVGAESIRLGYQIFLYRKA